MNAQRTAELLKANGYERTKTTNGDIVWWFEGMAVAEHKSPAKAAKLAYDHLYETNDDFVNPFALKPTTVPTANESASLNSTTKQYRIIRADSSTDYDLILFAPDGSVVMSGDFGCELEMITLRDTLNQETESLRSQLAKAQADLSATQAIIVKAGKDFEALKADNARMKHLINRIYSDVLASQDDNYRSIADCVHKWISDLQEFSAVQSPTPEAPQAEAVTHVTTTLMVDDIVLHKNGNGAKLVVSEIMGSSCVVFYRNSPQRGTMKLAIDSLALDYRPSWNKHAIAKQNAENHD